MKIERCLLAAVVGSLILSGSLVSHGEGNQPSLPGRAWPKLIKQEARFDIPREVQEMFYRPGMPLQGEVKHAEFLPPVNTLLRPGARFDDTALSAGRPDDLWMWVPPWLVGRFSTVFHRQIFTYDFRWHRIEQDDTYSLGLAHDEFGQQKDAAGHVWTYLGCPYTNTIMTVGGYVYQNYSRVEQVFLSPRCMVFKALYTAVSVSQPSHIISKVVQFVGISERKPIDDTHVRVEDSFKSFDENGQPLQLTRTISVAEKNSGFTKVDRLRGVDLRVSLKNFLLSRSMQALVPTE